jgi:hypothetical protein
MDEEALNKSDLSKIIEEKLALNKSNLSEIIEEKFSKLLPKV